jgi:hypothetical protein
MKVKVKKAFAHNGKDYKEGDEIELTQEEVRILARQGYCDEPEEKEGDNGSTTAPGTHPKAEPAAKASASEPVKRR